MAKNVERVKAELHHAPVEKTVERVFFYKLDEMKVQISGLGLNIVPPGDVKHM